MRWDTVLIP
ncbi:unnamed protein product [Cuscuta europaea]|uniref:Uncharacterized protein n=1 Tax=Cuscuta europaea TaxID=41803 RepID=A0A9P0YHP4_CUSEU|nr:unnamed protein product [Cuscuta europaea]